jgi:hypothetical protein
MDLTEFHLTQTSHIGRKQKLHGDVLLFFSFLFRLFCSSVSRWYGAALLIDAIRYILLVFGSNSLGSKDHGVVVAS